MILAIRKRTTTYIFIVLVIFIQTYRVYSEELRENTVDRLSISLELKNKPSSVRIPLTTQWQGREYDAETGIDILMGVIRDRDSTDNNREMALLQLGRLRTNLYGHTCLDELIERFDNVGEFEKKLILTTFMGSRDPRAIPLFVSVLDNEKNMKLRLSAAGWLAQWNIRRGVVEILDLLDSDELLPQPSRMPYVSDKALDLLKTRNKLKGWGFQEEKIRDSILNRHDLDDDQKRTKYNIEVRIEIKKWFAENKHRFPEWNAGDPLPEAEPKDKSD